MASAVLGAEDVELGASRKTSAARDEGVAASTEAIAAADNKVKVWGQRHRRYWWQKTSSQGPEGGNISACCDATVKPLPAWSVVATE